MVIMVEKIFSNGVYARAVLLVFIFAWMTSCGSQNISSIHQGNYQISGRASAGPLQIERIELSFENGFGSITVKQNSQLTAQALIRFSGSGVFRAEWQVDDRLIETVNLILSSGSLLKLSLSESTSLPAFEPGPHRLTLNIVQPQISPDMELPVIQYFVKLE